MSTARWLICWAFMVVSVAMAMYADAGTCSNAAECSMHGVAAVLYFFAGAFFALGCACVMIGTKAGRTRSE